MSKRSRAVVVDWHSFMHGTVIEASSVVTNQAILEGLAFIAAAASLSAVVSPDSVMAATTGEEETQFSDDASWADYVVPMLKHQGLPLAVTMCCWAALEMILRKPASAIDRAKWAIVGYLGLQFIMPFLRHLGHRFGDV